MHPHRAPLGAAGALRPRLLIGPRAGRASPRQKWPAGSPIRYTAPVPDPAFHLDVQRHGAAVTCRADGALVRRRGNELYRAVASHLRRGRTVQVSLAGVSEADAVGASALAALLDLAERSRGSVQVLDVSPSLAAQLEHLPAAKAPPESAEPGLLEWLGGQAERVWGLFVRALVFHADAFFGCLLGFVTSKNRRRGAVWRDALAIGADAVPVVGTIALLLGLILAFQGGHLMKDFGTSIYVANLVAKGMVREFAPLMTAIVVAGRSGAAIAAEIGAMKVSEELDALTVTGIEPVRYLVVPKIYAVSFTQPLLSVMASAVAILGGFVIGVTYLQLGVEQYLNQTVNALSVNDFVNCLFKSVIFGWIIVLVGAFQGLEVDRGAEGVGRAATRAVVTAIFSIIFTDGIITTVDTLLF